LLSSSSFAFFHNWKEKALENCSNKKTASHWRQRMNEAQSFADLWNKAIHENILDTALGKFTKNEMKRMTSGYRQAVLKYESDVKLYQNYKTKSLKHKLSYNDEFKSNFTECESIYKKNPISFEAIYK